MTPQSLLASQTGLTPYLRFGCLSTRLFYHQLTGKQRNCSPLRLQALRPKWIHNHHANHIKLCNTIHEMCCHVTRLESRTQRIFSHFAFYALCKLREKISYWYKRYGLRCENGSNILDNFISDLYKKIKKAQPPLSLHGQLLWREFFYCAATKNENFDKMEGNPICVQIPWDRNPEALAKWANVSIHYIKSYKYL